ncbi:MAG: hypothetical protein K5739_05995 [Lachnospiraceae bacterium]|nr:hypothetical protein [Lachnospiraceae bacterium]
MKEKNASVSIKPDYRYGITFLLAFILRFINYFRFTEFSFRSDDFGTLIYPALLAGRDWENVVQGLESYYGFGYYWIFAPLFYLIKDPKVLHMTIAMTGSLFIVLISVLIYRMLVRYCGFERDMYTCILAVLPTLFQGVTRTGMAGGSFWYRTDNEVPLFLTCYIIAFHLVKSQSPERTEKQRKTDAVIMALLLCYSLTFHERAMAIVLSAVILELFIFLTKKKWMFHPGYFFPTLVGGFLCERILRKLVFMVVWAGDKPSHNTSAFTKMGLWIIKTPTGIKSLLAVAFGNLHTMLIKTFGIPVFAMVLVVVWGVKNLPVLRKKYFAEHEEVRSEWPEQSLLLMAFFGICFMIILVGLAFRWGGFLYPAIGKGKISYHYKGISYDRYYYTFTGPILLGLLCYLKEHGMKKGQILAAWVVLFVSEAGFLALPFRMYKNADAIEGNSYVSRILGYNFYHRRANGLMTESFLIMGVVMLVITVALLVKAQKKKLFLGIAASAMVLVIFFDRLDWITFQKPEIIYLKQEKVISVLDTLEEENILPERVYIAVRKPLYNVIFADQSIEYYAGIPDDERFNDENLIILQKKNKEIRADARKLEEGGYNRIEIDEVLYYTNSEKILHELEQIR